MTNLNANPSITPNTNFNLKPEPDCPPKAGLGASLRTWPDLPQIRVIPCDNRLQIKVDPATCPPIDSDAVAARWATLCAANPRYHDGAILAVSAIDAEPNEPVTITCRHDWYRRLAVQPQVRTGVRLLGVTAVLLSHDDAGVPSVLLARRGNSVRVYPNQWELGPSGGVNVPPANIALLSRADLARAALDEIEEEIGPQAAALLGGPESLSTIAIIRDDAANSDDIILLAQAPAPATVRAAIQTTWEYSQSQWVQIDAIPAWDQEHAQQTLHCTRAIFRVMGWT